VTPRVRALAICTVAWLHLGASCEAWGPPALLLGNALLQAAAVNYGGDYAEELQIVVGAFSSASETALQAYLQQQQALALAEQDAAFAAELDASDFDVGDPFQSASSSIELDVALMKRVVSTSGVGVAPIVDGEILKDGEGDPTRGEQFRIYFRPNVDCNIYIVAVDSTGWMQPLYPSSFPGSPVALANHTYLLPDASHWYGLDENRGYQHIYFMASFERQPDLEVMLSRLSERERLPVAEARPVEEPLIVEERWIQERGLTGIRPGEVTVVAPDDVEAYQVVPVTFGFGVAGRDFVLTRFFEHR
jgi:hypothetical protein